MNAGVVIDEIVEGADDADIRPLWDAHHAVRDRRIAQGHGKVGVGVVSHHAGRIPLPRILLVTGEQWALPPAENALRRHVEEIPGVAGSALGVNAADAAKRATQARV